MIKKKSRNGSYWFTIQSPNGQTLATSETYTTAAMRDKGIEAVKKVVRDLCNEELFDSLDKIAKKGKLPIQARCDTFHLESAKGKIVKR